MDWEPGMEQDRQGVRQKRQGVRKALQRTSQSQAWPVGKTAEANLLNSLTFPQKQLAQHSRRVLLETACGITMCLHRARA